MCLVDLLIEFVVVGFFGCFMLMFGSWEYMVFMYVYDEVDFILMYVYYQEYDGDVELFLVEFVDMDVFIEGVIVMIDVVKVFGKYMKQVDIFFDEWNVWDQVKYNDVEVKEIVKVGWCQYFCLIEDIYLVMDVVVVGILLNSFLCYGDCVKIVNQVQLVNVIVLICLEENGLVWCQMSFWFFECMVCFVIGCILCFVVIVFQIEIKCYGGVDVIDVVVIWDEEFGCLVVFVVNCLFDEVNDLMIDLYGFGDVCVWQVEMFIVFEGGDCYMLNFEIVLDSVYMVLFMVVEVFDGVVWVILLVLFWLVIEFEVVWV